jgi:alkylation response protein AidB-like acyl-CoA dehydrogenase
LPDIYGLKAEQLPYRERAAALAGSVLSAHAAAVDADGRFPEESIRAMVQQNLLGLCVPLEFGGSGQGPRVFAAVVEELANGCSSTAMIFVMHVAATQVLIASRTLARRPEILTDIAEGRHLTTLAFSEAGSRSQFWAPVSTLTQNGDGYTTTARKSWVTSAQHADSYVSSAQRPGARSPLESTLYLLDRADDGVRVAGSFNGLGLRGNDSAPVVLDRAHVAEADLLTPQGEGAAMMLQVVLPWFNVGTAALANGLCRAAVAATAGHLQSANFVHTATGLRDLPTLRARLAEMSTRTEQARALLGYALDEMEAPTEATPLYVLQSRLAAIDAVTDVTDLAMKACGGAAFSRQLPLERLFRDARAGWVMAPTADHLREFVGRALTGLPLF